ncbi:MAG: transglycosylase SLT domain-containing protein [Qingshengfaniella sp.]
MAITQGAQASPTETCGQAAARAAHDTGVPVEVLMAVSLTETGRRTDGQLHAWPWALNVAGEGFWLPTREAALAKIRTLRAADQRNFDVGCFQINYRWHGQAFTSFEEMIDPEINARYAADFLARLYAESGDWSRAAGSYHSMTPELAARYRQTFDRHYAALSEPGTPLPGLVIRQHRENRFPLLQGGAGNARPGSLFPKTSSRTPLLRAAPAPFWSGT